MSTLHLPKNQRSNLNTLPRLRPLSSPLILESSMRHPRPRLAIKTLQQQPLLIPHPAPIIPLRLLPERHSRRLPGAIGIPVLHARDGLFGHGGRVRDGEGKGLDGPVEGPPYVDEAVAALQERLRVIRGV